MLNSVAVSVACALTAAGEGDRYSVTLPSPVLDQWVYPFSFQPGSKPTASIFAAWIDGGYAKSWDNRDGQMLVAFDTSAQLPVGFDPARYVVESLTITIWVEGVETFEYDPTYDMVETYGPDQRGKIQPDTDSGRPVELFLTDFRNGFTPLTYLETTSFSALGVAGKGIRNAFPIAWIDGVAGDVSNSVDAFVNVTPAAIGTVNDLEPGDLVPAHVAMHFTLDLTQTELRAALGERLALGRLHFSVASLFVTNVQGTTGYPRFHTKESSAIPAGPASPPRLDAVIFIAPETSVDLDGDGAVGPTDLGILLGAWGSLGPGDLDGDGTVGPSDLGILLGGWSA